MDPVKRKKIRVSEYYIYILTLISRVVLIKIQIKINFVLKMFFQKKVLAKKNNYVLKWYFGMTIKMKKRQIGSDICIQYICIVSFKEDHPPLGLWYSCDFKKKIWEILSMHHDIFDYIVWIWDTCFALYITYQHIKVFPSFLGHLYPAFHGEPKQYLCAECSFRLPILYPRRDNPTCLCISLANNNYPPLPGVKMLFIITITIILSTIKITICLSDANYFTT